METLVDGFIKLFFFLGKNLEDKALLLFQFRISVFRSFDHRSAQFCQELALNTQKTSMTGSPADQTAEHIASSFIGRHDTVRDHKGSRTDMVCDQTDRNVLFFVFLILGISQLAHFISQSAESIYIKDRIYILNYRSQTLQSHTCINIFLDQFCIMTFSVIIKLAEYVVPDLHVPVAVAAYRTVRFAAAVFFSSVIVDL